MSKRNKKKKQIKIKLPKELIFMPNADKGFHEKWYKGRDLLNIPHPARVVLMGPPHMGKTNVMKNLILRADPPFEEIVLIHCDIEYTKEYDDLGENVTKLKEIPKPEEWEGLVKTLVVLDDLEFKGMGKQQKRNLDRLVGYCSTHKNLSVYIASQDAFALPTIVRRCANLWIMWRMLDLDSLATCARKTGLKSSNLNNIFDHLMMDPRDSLWIDHTFNSPAKMRRNGYTRIKKYDGKDTQKMKDKADKFEVTSVTSK